VRRESPSNAEKRAEFFRAFSAPAADRASERAVRIGHSVVRAYRLRLAGGGPVGSDKAATASASWRAKTWV
jgi:hypothetical protein